VDRRDELFWAGSFEQEAGGTGACDGDWGLDTARLMGFVGRIVLAGAADDPDVEHDLKSTGACRVLIISDRLR
jgi:hypothetical protein